jgi:hypothetical protein
MSKPNPEPEPEPIYTRLEMFTAALLVNAPRPEPDKKRDQQAFAKTISLFLFCDGPDRVNARLAAIAAANKDHPDPISVHAVQLPEHLMPQHIKDNPDISLDIPLEAPKKSRR